jgi:hypothetical protein
MASKKLTYAQVADKLTKKIGKLEEKIKQGGRYKAGDERMLSVLNQKKEQLFAHQEQMKKDAYQKENTALMNKYGMSEQATAGQQHQMPDGSMMPGAQHQYGYGGIPKYFNGADLAQGTGQFLGMAANYLPPGVSSLVGGLGAGLENVGTGADFKEVVTDVGFGAAKKALGPMGNQVIGGVEQMYNDSNNSASEQKDLWESRYDPNYVQNQEKEQNQRNTINNVGQLIQGGMQLGGIEGAEGSIAQMSPNEMQMLSGMGGMGMAYGGNIPKYNLGGPTTPPTIADIQRQYPQFTPEEHQNLLRQAFTKYNDVQNRRRLAGQDYGEPAYYDADQNPNLTGNEVYPSAASRQSQNNNPISYNQKSSRESSAAGNYDQTQSDIYNKLNSPDYTQKNDLYYGNSSGDAGAPKSEAGPYDNYTSSPDFDPNGGNKSGSRFGDYAKMAGKYAPTIYNTIKGFQKPEQVGKGTYYNPYEQESMDLMKGRRYNVDPELEANNRSYNAMRGSIGQAAGGDSSSYLATLGSALGNKQRADSRAYAMKQNMDNQYIGQEAQALTGFGQGRAKADMYTDDVNAQARARQGDYQAAAATGLSQATFNEERNRNLSDADRIRANTLQGMYGDYGYSTDDRGYLTGNTYYKGNRGN